MIRQTLPERFCATGLIQFPSGSAAHSFRRCQCDQKHTSGSLSKKHDFLTGIWARRRVFGQGLKIFAAMTLTILLG
jgi:hypothetical protein